MWPLKISGIAAVGANRYEVVFVDSHGNETRVICEVAEGRVRHWNPITETTPDIFMMGYADIKATGRALYEFHDRRGRGEG